MHSFSKSLAFTTMVCGGASVSKTGALESSFAPNNVRSPMTACLTLFNLGSGALRVLILSIPILKCWF